VAGIDKNAGRFAGDHGHARLDQVRVWIMRVQPHPPGKLAQRGHSARLLRTVSGTLRKGTHWRLVPGLPKELRASSSMDTEPSSGTDLLTAAQQGDSAAFGELTAGHRRELYAHCYRMLGSVQDAEDAVQEALLAAWRGMAGFERRSSLRAWLYRIATNVCLRLIDRRPRRILSPEHGPPRSDTADLGEPVTGPVWLEPILDEVLAGAATNADPEARYVQQESVELAFIAALQHLPGTQRAVLILREVLQFSAAEVAELLDTSTASVNSALQRARATVDQRLSGPTQRDELARLGADGQRELVDSFVTAWQRADVPALLELLTDDARFTMPPLPAWFDGRAYVGQFLAERVFAMPWRLVPLDANGQLGFACYAREAGDDVFKLSAVNLLTVRDDRVAEISAFLDPDLLEYLRLPPTL
jgi:RNA polymerase sigma-70 factor (TIGR02960 family)